MALRFTQEILDYVDSKHCVAKLFNTSTNTEIPVTVNLNVTQTARRFELHTKEGYVFTETPRMVYDYGVEVRDSSIFTLVNNTKATALNSSTANNYFIIETEAISLGEPVFILTNNMVNSMDGFNPVFKINESVIEVGGEGFNSQNLTLEIENGTFKEPPYLEAQDPLHGTPIYLYFDLVSDSKASVVLTDAGDWEYLTVDIEPIVIPPVYIITQDDYDNIRAIGGNFYANGVLVGAGYGFNVGDELKLMLVGYRFTGDVILYDLDPALGSQRNNLILSDDNTVATITLESDKEYTHFYYTATVVTPDVSGTNNVYLIDSDILASVNQARIVPIPNYGYSDYGEFIISVLAVPFSIPNNVILEPENIMLGTLNTGVEANKLSNDKLFIDLGSIEVNPVFGDLRDYKNTTAILNLPRTTPIALDINEVMGGVITIQYVLDCYTGNVTINVNSSLTGGLISTTQSTIGVNIPYIFEGGSAIASNSNIQLGGLNNVNIPYIEIIRFNDPLNNSNFIIPIADESKLNLANGYVEIEYIDLIVDTTLDELIEIQNLLQSGVLINE